MSFPTRRFAEAGATESDLERLEAEFDALPAPVKDAQAERWAGLATPDLAELIAARDEQEAQAELEDASTPGIALPKPTASDASSTDEGAKPEAPAPPAK